MGAMEVIQDSHHGFTKGKHCLTNLVFFWQWDDYISGELNINRCHVVRLHKAFDTVHSVLSHSQISQWISIQVSLLPFKAGLYITVLEAR